MRIVAWAVDAANPGRPVELEIVVGDEVIGTLVANRYRGDLYEAGFGSGAHAFMAILPPAATSLADVSLRRVGDRAELHNPAKVPAI